MPAAKSDDATFIETVENSTSLADAGRKLQVDIRDVHRRRRHLEAKYSIEIHPGKKALANSWHPKSLRIDCDGPFDLLLYGDSHVWPGEFRTPAFYALKTVAKLIRPRICVDMGDSIDGATISRHMRHGWDQQPTLRQEYDANKEFRGEIEESLPKDCENVWLLGNHDLRWMGKLSNVVPQYEGIPGTDLAHVFAKWRFGRSLVINDTLLCLHRFRNTTHAGYANTRDSGVNIATGHDHKLEARSYNDFRGLRYGIRTGTLANIYGPQFEYTEQTPVDWCHGLVVVHVDSRRIWPEPIVVLPDEFRFRGKTYKVK